MIIPASLKAGDKVAIVATARKISMREIEPSVAVLREWGLEPVIGSTIGAEYFQFAGDDDLRRKDFQSMLDDEKVRAILCARGGYGTVRIVDDIDWRKFLKSPKWLCGFSDFTVINSHLLSVYEVATIHSLMAINIETGTFDAIDSLRKALLGEKTRYEIPTDPLNRNGDCSGVLCGGNLSVLYSINGTASDIETADRILFIEDIDEYLYHIDRMMMNLKRSGKLEGLAGLIVGSFSDMKNKDEANPFGKSAYEIISEHVAEYDYPVCFGFPSGHIPDQRTLIIGARYQLKVHGSAEMYRL